MSDPRQQMKPTLSIIIPTKDRGYVFDQTIRSAVEAIKNRNAEIIVINDSKTSALKLPETYKCVKVIDNPNSGVASARNLGVKNASSDLLLFADDDTLLNESNIIAILETQKKFPNSAINLNWEYPIELVAKIQKTQFGRFLIAFGFTTAKGWYNHPSWNDNAIFE